MTDTDPSPEALRRYIEAQICPWCGAGPFRTLAQHTNLSHGVDRKALRRLAGLKRRDRTCSPEQVAARRDLLLGREDYARFQESGQASASKAGAWQVALSASRAAVTPERAVAQGKVASFLATERTWADLARLAEEYGVTPKSFAATIKTAGESVPDGRSSSTLRGKGGGRVYPTKPKSPCSESGCDGHAIKRGMCGKHYQRARKAGAL